MDSTAPLVPFARSAIEAGHDAQNVKNVRVTTRSWGMRNETVLSYEKKDSTKAENWIAYWGNTDKMGDWKDEKLGGGERMNNRRPTYCPGAARSVNVLSVNHEQDESIRPLSN